MQTPPPRPPPPPPPSAIRGATIILRKSRVPASVFPPLGQWRRSRRSRRSPPPPKPAAAAAAAAAARAPPFPFLPPSPSPPPPKKGRKRKTRKKTCRRPFFLSLCFPSPLFFFVTMLCDFHLTFLPSFSLRKRRRKWEEVCIDKKAGAGCFFFSSRLPPHFNPPEFAR